MFWFSLSSFYQITGQPVLVSSSGKKPVAWLWRVWCGWERIGGKHRAVTAPRSRFSIWIHSVGLNTQQASWFLAHNSKLHHNSVPVPEMHQTNANMGSGQSPLRVQIQVWKWERCPNSCMVYTEIGQYHKSTQIAKMMSDQNTISTQF